MEKNMKRLIAILLLLPIILLGALGAFLLLGNEAHVDVAYLDDGAHTMDVYLPRLIDEGEPQGVLLFIHGGSWSSGDKSDEAIRCRLLASLGYVTASINYTLWTEETKYEYRVTDVLDEIDAAMLKLGGFLSERGIAVGKVALAGYSAGGHLALLYAYSRSATAPYSVAFVSSMAGPTDVSEAVWGRDMTKRVGTRLTGVEITDAMLDTGEADGLLAAVSPVSYVTPDAPPTLLMHGGKDTTVPVANAESLLATLGANGVRHDYVYMDRSDHILIQNPLAHLTYFKLLLGYCREYF